MALYFVDLFAGIGGFHKAITAYADENNIDPLCIFASEKDPFAARVYELNFNIDPLNDITSNETHELLNDRVEHFNRIDLLFAGFPCQPFSHAGNQNGFLDIERGNLFFEISRILDEHRPKAVLLENVRNFFSHDNNRTWKEVRKILESLDYKVDYVIMGPNSIPQNDYDTIPALRDRAFIMAYRNDVNVDETQFYNGRRQVKYPSSIYDINGDLKQEFFLPEDTIRDRGVIPDINSEIINMWNDFKVRIEDNQDRLISPIWTDYFELYPELELEPDWKKKIINKNVEFYSNNKEVIDEWDDDYSDLLSRIPESSKKLEWNAGNAIDNIWEGIIQFRPSGVRVKRPDSFPTFVAINQTPIIGPVNRYLLPEEMSLIYGFGDMNFGDQNEKQSYKQLGNTVSVDVVKHLIEHMFNISNLNELINQEEDVND